MSKQRETRAVDPARLASGQWCHQRNRQIGEGDISRSYSADRIGMGKPVRLPFRFEGAQWVCTGSGGHHHRGGAEAYRLVHPSQFSDRIFSYGERSGEEGRTDPKGFYHGMRVRHRGEEFVLCGAPVVFVAGEPEQPELFD